MTRVFARALLVLGLPLCALAHQGYSKTLEYPAPNVGTVVDDYHGTRVPDPYRGLEDLDSPATRAWVGAEAQVTERYLAKLPDRDRLRTRLSALFNYERFGVPFQARGRYFYSHNS